ncbi:MAG: hypothetical protein WBV55_16610 [Candidatus Sulfotelmatobacter sp.]
MAEPRKKKKKRKTGRPLEHVPMRTLVGRVKEEIHEKLRMSFSGPDDKRKQD